MYALPKKRGGGGEIEIAGFPFKLTHACISRFLHEKKYYNKIG
jgi:hypothetical protein